MFMSPSVSLFLTTILLSVFLMTSSPSLFVSWLALEMNAMAFIPLLLGSQQLKTGEIAVKYFLSQTLGSIWILLAIIAPLNTTKGTLLLVSGLALKLGTAPFHVWLPSMVNLMPWFTLYFLFTVQKINPLIMLVSYSNDLETYLILLLSTSLMVGSILGISQTQIRKILAYSSINQVGWLLMTTYFSMKMLLIFFSIYCLILGSVIFSLKSSGMNVLKQSNINMNEKLNYIFYLNLLSLGGLPPFLGFLTKWLVLSASSVEFPVISLLMVFMSLLTLYFYLRISTNSFLLSMNSWSMLTNEKINFLSFILTQLCLGSLFLAVILL